MDPAALLVLYEKMLLIRKSEEQLATLFAEGKVPGFLHLSIGQEAVPVGVCAALASIDTVASTHRGHGHALAKGVDLKGFFAELMGREDGLCRGRGGSMHVADMKAGMLGANGIVGGGIALAVGSALAHQVRRTAGLAVVFFGDGAMAEGILHESLNLSSLWKLPLLFVCENNGWSEFTPTARQFVPRLGALAAAFGISAEQVDGTDVEAVHGCASRLVGEARSGQGPRVLECMTSRWRGHFEGDPQKYRDATDIAAARGRDPLVLAAARLQAMGIPADRMAAVARGVEAHVNAAVAAAEKAAEPEFEVAASDVYASGSDG